MPNFDLDYLIINIILLSCFAYCGKMCIRDRGAPFVVATESFTSLSVVATLKLIRTLSIFFTVQSLGFSVAMQ